YLGRDSIEPFLKRCRESGSGIYLLLKTSNPGSMDLQDLEAGNLRVYEEVALLIRDWSREDGLVGAGGWSSVGAVVGATHPTEAEQLRKSLPGVPFLVPGYGAQGGGAADVVGAFDEKGEGAVVNSSRGILFPYASGEGAEKYGEAQWERAVEEAVTTMHAALRDALANAHGAPQGA
ncbi:MAG: orotidine-5'-phosphate decarboxylase, partial [Planctomycetota bacterium]